MSSGNISRWGRGVRDAIDLGSRKVRDLESANVPVGRLNGLLLLIVLWTALAEATPADLMPTPLQTLGIVWEFVQSGSLWVHLWATLTATFWGFVGALVLGTAVGVALGVNTFARRLIVPHVMIFLSISGVSAAAVATLVFGFSFLAPVAATIVTVFPYIAINVWKGTENIDRELITMADAFDVSFPRMLRRSILPNVAPSLFSSFRFGLATAWKIVTIAEMFAASRGLGYKLMNTYSQYRFQEAWAWGLVFLVVILIIEYGVFKPLERRTFAYRSDATFDLMG